MTSSANGLFNAAYSNQKSTTCGMSNLESMRFIKSEIPTVRLHQKPQVRNGE